MSHAYHDPSTVRSGVDAGMVVLFDECEGCDRIAERPTTEADLTTLALLWDEMLRVERSRGGPMQAYRTRAEARAGRYLHGIGIMLERVGWGPRAWTLFG